MNSKIIAKCFHVFPTFSMLSKATGTLTSRKQRKIIPVDTVINMAKCVAILVLMLFIGLPNLNRLAAQDYSQIAKDLEEKQKNTRYEIKALNKQIETYQQRISVTEDKFQRLYEEYQNLQKEIQLRTELVNKLGQQQDQISEEIAMNREAFNGLQTRIDSLIYRYQKSLTYLYKNGQSAELVLLFTSKSLNQMLVRSKYLEKFESYREEQLTEIEEAQEELTKKKEELEQNRQENALVIAQINAERKNLVDKKQQQQKVIDALQQNKSKLKAQLDESRKQINELNNMLTALVIKEEEVRQAQDERLKELEKERLRRLKEAQKIEDAEKRRAEVAKYSKPVAVAGRSSTSEDQRLQEIENKFATLEGTLSMPVENGVITEDFGTQVHPVYGTKINNPGVEISAEPRSVVRAVYDGVVYAVQPIRGYGDVVLVNHGKYKTVYANLSEIMVSKGTFLNAGEIIGLSGDDNSTLGASIFFMIRHGKVNLNPKDWIAGR